MPDPEEDPAGSSAQKSAFRPVDSGQFQIGTLIFWSNGVLPGVHAPQGSSWQRRIRRVFFRGGGQADTGPPTETI